MSRASRRIWQLIVTLAGACAIAGIGIALFLLNSGPSDPSAHSVIPKETCTKTLPATAGHYIGAVVRPVTARQPFKSNIAELYTGFGGHFPGSLATRFRAGGMVPFIQVNPRNVKITGIAAGHYDTYLRTYARDAKRFCTPLLFSFGHEFNGPWYSWGFKDTPPQTFVAAWRHMHDIFAQEGATNVIWAWDPDHAAKNPAPWWPGSPYVNWIGMDGYFRKPGQTSFRTLFGNRIAEIRKFSKAPILIAETGAPPSNQRAKQIRILLGGVHSYGLLGMIYFDIPGIQDYRINADPAALAVLKRASAAVVH
jgi:mannan endo-1,4-beta-mannosidase